MLASISRALASPRVPLACALIAVLLSLPSLRKGFLTDDRLLLLQIEQGAELFSLFRVPSELYPKLKARGAFSWWTGPEVDVAFFRPLAELSHRLDFALFGWNALPMRAINVLLYGLIVWIAAHAFRQLLPARAAGIAALVFAIDDAHAFSVGWIAGRNTLLATLFGLAAVLAHVHARDRRALRIASPVLLALSLASAELGLTALAFLLAHALCLETGPLVTRLRAHAGHALVVMLWAGTYVLLGYGAHGVGAYRDVFDAPLATLVAGVLDVPLWLFSQLGLSIAGALMAAPDGARLVPALLGIVLSLFLWPTFRERSESRFFAIGFLLALVPLMSTSAQDRVLLLASFGGAGFLGCAFASIAEQSSRARRLGLRGLATLHLAFAPLLFLPSLSALEPFERAASVLAASFPRADGHHVILVNSPNELLSLYSDGIHRQARGPDWGSVHQLYAGHAAVTVERTDARSLELRVAAGYCARRIERLFTSPRFRKKPGDRLRAGPLDVTILETNAEQLPTAVRFVFEEPLESSRYVFRAWKGSAPSAWTPPAIGARVELDPLPLMRALPR